MIKTDLIKLIFKSLYDSITHFLLALLLLSFGVIYFFGETSVGLETTINIITSVIPGKFHYDKARGKLFSNFSIENFTYTNASEQIKFSHLHLDWNIHALLQSKLSINDFVLNDLHINYFSSKNPSSNNSAKTNFDPNDLGFLKYITAHNVLLTNLLVTDNGAALIYFQNLHLQKLYNQIAFNSLTLNGHLDGMINVEWQPYFAWKASIVGTDLNPAELWKAWPGKINFSLFSEGKIDPKTSPAIKINLSKLSGNLRAQTIEGSIQASYLNHNLHIEKSYLNYANANIQVSGNFNSDWNINWNIDLPNVGLLMPEANGQLTVKGKILGERDHPTITALLQGNKLVYQEDKINNLNIVTNLVFQPNQASTINIKASGADIQTYQFNKIDLGARGNYAFSKNMLLAKIGIDIADKHYIDFSLSVPKNISAKNYKVTPMTAELSLNFPNLKLISEYFPSEIKNPQGVLRGLLNFSGTFGSPLVAGNIHLSDGSFSIAELNILLQKINLDISGNQSKKLVYSGSAQSDKGTLNLTGSTDFSRADFPTTLSLKGTNLQVMNTSEYKIIASPDIFLQYENNKLALQGTVFIPKARITPKDFSKTVTLPDDVVFVNSPHPIAQSTTQTYLPNMQITLKLGDDIFVKYEDLKTKLIGNLTITSADNRYATANGELNAVNGKYDAYGQSLKIQEGNLIYAGNLLTNPGLNIKAVKTINTVSTTPSVNPTLGNAAATPAANYTYAEKQKITVGVKITGNLNKPVIALFSDPANLTQSNILSYLVLGIPDSQASGSTKQALLNAASALSMSGGGKTSKITEITKKLQKTLGLTELGVQSVQRFDPTSGSVVGTTSLVVGKKIADKLYVNYSIGLFTPVSILDLRYQFNKHWAIQSETSSLDKGADILYSIERD